MRDIIDKRDEQERISRSIVKFWNVNYIPAHAADEKMGLSTGEQELAREDASETPDREHSCEQGNWKRRGGRRPDKRHGRNSGTYRPYFEGKG